MCLIDYSIKKNDTGYINFKSQTHLNRFWGVYFQMAFEKDINAVQRMHWGEIESKFYISSLWNTAYLLFLQ